jgi:hypothetical protein
MAKPMKKVRSGIGSDNHDVEIERAAVGSTDPACNIIGHRLRCNVDMGPQDGIGDTRSMPRRRETANDGTELHEICRLIPENANRKALDSVD